MPRLLLLRAYFFFAFGVAGLYVPYFPAWLRARGFQGAELSSFLCLLPISALLTPLTIGIVSDYLGVRARLITLAALVSTAGIAVVAWLSSANVVLPFVPALVGVALFALGRAPMLSLGDVMAMENDPRYGRTRLWGSVGFVSSSLLGGMLLESSAPLDVPLAIVGYQMAAIAISVALPKVASLPPRPALKDASALLAQGRFQGFLVMSGFAYGALSAYDFASTFRLQELGAGGNLVGIFWATATTSEVLLMFFGFRITSLFSAEKLLPWILALGALRWWLMAELDSPWMLVLIQPVHAIVFGLFILSSVDVLRRAARGRGMATAQGILSVGTSIGSTSGFVTWGPLHATHGSTAVFRAAAALSAAAGIAAFLALKGSSAGTDTEGAPPDALTSG